MAIKGQAQLTVVDLTDGYTVNMTRDSYIFTGDVNGNVAATETFTVKISGLQGSTAVPCSVNTNNITLPSAGLTVTSDNDAVSPTLTFTATTALTDTVLGNFGGLIAIPITVNSDITVTKGIAIAVAEKGGTGQAGAAAYNYALIVSPSAVVRAENGGLSPAKISLSATRGQGTGTPAAYSGRFKIELYIGSSWTTTGGYTSSTNQSSYEYTIPSGTTATLIRCSLYLAGGTTTLLDQQTVPIVTDGDTGPQGASGYTVVLSNESHTFPAGVTNALQSSTSTAVIAYQGTTRVAAQIGTVSGQVTGLTTSISNNNTTTATVTINAATTLTTKNGTLTIPVTIGGQSFTKYFTWSLSNKGDTGAQGPQGNAGADAITVGISASGSAVFKNNSGSVTLTATVTVGSTPATVADNGTVTYNGTTLGTIKWYKDASTTAVATAKSYTVEASYIDSTALYTAKLEG